jgi:hypothetical protein
VVTPQADLPYRRKFAGLEVTVRNPDGLAAEDGLGRPRGAA